MELKFPILMFFDGQLIADNGIGLRARGVKFPDKHTLLCPEHYKNPKDKPGWILEKTGDFIELNPTVKRREWSRFLKPIWVFVQSQYHVTDRRKIHIGELINLLKDIEDPPYQEIKTAGDLKEFLKKYDNNILITEEILSSWPL